MTTSDRRFEDIFRAHFSAVHAYVRRRVGSGVEDDILADTFAILWRRLDDVPDDSLPWLYGVARRVISNHSRARDRQLALARRLANTRDVSAPDHGELFCDSEHVREALMGLSAHEREALLLVAWEGLDRARAARAAGCTRATFAVRLHRARKHVAREIAALDGNALIGEPPIMEGR
jgi:RNA polymerase sigma factor (sigma-70 family)